MSSDKRAISPVEFFILALLPDHCAPLSIVLPQVLPLTLTSIAEFFLALRQLENSHMIRIWDEDPSGNTREPSGDDYETIQSEYETGIRDARAVRQIFDRDDLWLEITGGGRQTLFSEPYPKGAQQHSGGPPPG